MNSETRTLYLIRLVDYSVRVALDRALREVDSTIVQYTLFSILRGNANVYSSADIARRLQITPQAANELIMSAEGKGLIARRPNPENARTRLIRLSSKGQRTLDLLDHHVDRVEREVLAALTPKELKVFRHTLDRLINNNQEQPKGLTSSLTARSD